MEYTSVEQDRQEILLSDGVTKVYRIRTAVVDKGELPFIQIFVFKIEDEIDSSTDTFTRVGTPYDLETYATSRPTAITNGDDYYLAAEFTRDFTGLETAKQAKDAIYSRIDTLASTWFDYITNFRGVDDISSHPSVSPEFEQQLKDAYADAKADRIQAESDLEDADEALEDAQTAADNAAAIEAIYKDEVDFCIESYNGYWTDFLAVSNQLYTDSNVFFTAMVAAFNAWSSVDSDSPWPAVPSTGTSQAARTTMHTAMVEYQLDLNIYNSSSSGGSLAASFLAFCQDANNEYSIAQNNKVARDADVAAAVTAKKEAEAVVTSAQVAEAAALAAVLAVCPDFDPLSV